MFTILILIAIGYGLLFKILLGDVKSIGRGNSYKLKYNFGKGGSSTTVINPTPDPAPTQYESAQDWAKAMPTIYQTQLEYAPKEAQMQYDLMSKYALPLAQLEKSYQEQLNPETSKLQEEMAASAREGMNATEMPDWMKKNYRDEMKANLGSNVGSPIAADYMSTGMQKQLFNQQKYYNDLGLSLAGRQPLVSGAQPQATNYMSSATPSAGMSFDSANYGSFSQASRPLTGQKTESSRLWGLW